MSSAFLPGGGLRVGVRSVPLLPRRLPVLSQNAVNKARRRPQSGPFPIGELPFPWHGVAYRLPNHPPVRLKPAGYTFDRPDAVFVLAPDLLGQFHFRPPVYPASVLDRQAQKRRQL